MLTSSILHPPHPLTLHLHPSPSIPTPFTFIPHPPSLTLHPHTLHLHPSPSIPTPFTSIPHPPSPHPSPPSLTLHLHTLLHPSPSSIPHPPPSLTLLHPSPSISTPFLLPSLTLQLSTEHLNIVLFTHARRYHQAMSRVTLSVIDGPHLHTSTSASHPSQPSAAAPNCSHGPALLRCVKKAGPNQGRMFYTCSASGPGQCKVRAGEERGRLGRRGEAREERGGLGRRGGESLSHI